MANSEDTPIISNYVTVSGRVTPIDGIYRENIPVKISPEEGMEETLYTDSEGYYEGTILLGSSNDIIAKVGNDKAIWKLIDGITLHSDKQIISYNGGNNPECATLTAQLTKNNSNVKIAGKTITFEIRKKSDDSLVETLTAATDSSGIATVSYYGKGAGDIYIKASCMFVSKTYSIKDMIKYDDATSDKSNKFSFISNPNASSISHQTDYYQVNYTRTAESNPVKINLAEFVCENDFEASIDVYYTASNPKQFTWKISGNSNFTYDNMSEIGTWSGSRIFRTFVGTQSYSSNLSGHLPQSTWLTLKFKKQNGNILLQAYNGSTLINEYSSGEWEQSTTIIMGLQISEYISTLRFKNLKIKAL